MDAWINRAARRGAINRESGMTEMTAEMQALKDRLKATWMSGDYGYFAKYLEPGAMAFLKDLAVAPGTRMLDVGCGAGQIAIPAARAGAIVTGIDLASNLIDQARARAVQEGLSVQFDVGDAEMLPYPDASFELVVSLIGAMFAPRPELVASELLRVCKRAGRIVMANWTPEGHVGQMFKVIAQHVPPPPLMVSPLKWGDPATARDRLAPGAASMRVRKLMYPMQYPFGPQEVVNLFFTFYGPTLKAYAALDDAGKAALRADLEALWTAANTATDGSTLVMSEYLEVTAMRA